MLEYILWFASSTDATDYMTSISFFVFHPLGFSSSVNVSGFVLLIFFCLFPSFDSPLRYDLIPVFGGLPPPIGLAGKDIGISWLLKSMVSSYGWSFLLGALFLDADRFRASIAIWKVSSAISSSELTNSSIFFSNMFFFILSGVSMFGGIICAAFACHA